MDFQQLISLASQNQKKAEKKLSSSKKYSTQVSAPKKLQKPRIESETLKRLRKEKEKEKLRTEKEKEKEKERNDLNYHITERIKEQKRREDALLTKKMEKVRSKVHQDKEKSKVYKVRIDKQIEKAKERRDNTDEKNLTPKMREKLKEERLREKLREIKLKDKLEIQMTTEAMATGESKKEGFKIPKGSSDEPKSSLPNEKSLKSSTSIISAGVRPLYKMVSNQSENSSKTATKKPVTKGPPPIDFNSLMKLASQKASVPKAAAATATAIPNLKNLTDRPMTQEEKERHQRMSSKQFKEWYKYGTSPERSESPTETLEKDGKSGGDKVRKKETIDGNKKDKRPSDCSSLEKKRPDSMNGDPKRKPTSSDPKISSKSKNDDDLADKYKALEQKYKALEEKLKQQRSAKEKMQKSSGQKSSSSSSSSSNHTSNSQNKQMSSKNSGKSYAVENNNLLICRPAEKAPEKDKSAWDRIYDQIQKSAPVKKPVKRKRVIDSDEEEDEEMADFIDDEPMEDEYSSNYSKCIREIFGYDRRKFKYDDGAGGDDDDMETSYAQQMKEEIRSAKIGILEDLEDIRLEKEQKKKAKLKY